MNKNKKSIFVFMRITRISVIVILIGLYYYSHNVTYLICSIPFILGVLVSFALKFKIKRKIK
ncbi:hypothetical protein D0U04_10520 [Bacillus clarus]|uniref:Putative membrane protein n=1 Tax=Bacillus clarus TaxID=2338372 RepID=A0A090YLW0_9BACI|nr:putative membrane protein [Bacillus clarus]RFT67185.1 hypothetical protein D0U04_10520 [Bacillus clarus]